MRDIDPADLLLLSGLGSLTIGALLVSPVLGFIVFGLGAMYLGLLAGRAPEKP